MGIYRKIIFPKPVLQCSFSGPNLSNGFKPNYGLIAMSQARHNASFKKEKEKIGTYVVHRYIDYVKTQFLEKRFPTAMNMYRIFGVGIKEFFQDLKRYISLRIQVLKDRGFSKMSRKDIELFQKMPSDMLKIAPVLLLAAIPFGNYVIFPLALWKPKKLLCSHFWSIQQKAEFSTQDLSERLKYNKPVFRALQAKVDSISDNYLKTSFKKVVALLGSGVHPTPTDLLECKLLFSEGPYQLQNLSYAHLGYLLRMHGLRKSIFRTNKLKYRAFLLLEMDKAIIREGGLDTLNTESLRNACNIRGLHDTHLSNKDMKEWLAKWLEVSLHVDKTSYSLILHCPIFFAYNHPQNWVLIY